MDFVTLNSKTGNPEPLTRAKFFERVAWEVAILTLLPAGPFVNMAMRKLAPKVYRVVAQTAVIDNPHVIIQD